MAFSAQPRAIARLARKSRSRRFETSRSLILWVTSGAPANGVGSPSDLDELGSLNISITGLRAADRNLLGGGHASGTHHCHSNNKYQGSHSTFLRPEYRRQFLTAGESLETREVLSRICLSLPYAHSDAPQFGLSESVAQGRRARL